MLPSLHTLATVPPLKLVHETEAGAGEGLEGLFFRSRAVTDGVVEVDGLFMLIFWFSMFFFVLLMALMVYWGFFKYRRRPGVPAPRSPSHNTPLELIWTIVPSSALLVIFFLGFWTYIDRQVASGDALRLEVTAWKWDWGVTYPSGAQSAWQLKLDPGATKSFPVIVVPEDTPIALRMKSNDVIHSFWIPDFRVKMDVFPNRYTGYTFQTPKLAPGEDYTDHWIFCAEYCGDFHSEMAAVLRVVPYGQFKDITENQWSLGDLSPIEIGQRVHASKCVTCHTVDGSSMTGPTWLNAYGAEIPLADGTTVIGDDNYIRESILYPGAKIHAGYANVMPAFETLSEQEIVGVIAYMESLSEFGSTGEDEAAEGEGEGESETEGEGGDPAAEEAEEGATGADVSGAEESDPET